MAVKNKGASVLARLRSKAKEESISYQMSLQLFFQEEFLRRLAHSRYKENLILKGGMFIYVLTEFDSRPTRDMDFMIQSLSNEVQNIKNVMEEICRTRTDNDYIWLEVTGAEAITPEKEYPGVKIKLTGHIVNVRVPFSIDMGIDDVIVPGAQIREIPTRLEGFEAPEIYMYSIESTIAEKFDAILQRMETTSRMKDFFDIYYLSNVFNFDGELLKNALMETMKHRERDLEEDVFTRIEEFGSVDFFRIQWKKFEPAAETNLAFADMLKRLSDFLGPVYAAILHGDEFHSEWQCPQRKWRK